MPENRGLVYHSTYLIPASKEFSIRIFEEASNISTTEGVARHGHSQTHWHRHLHVVPVSKIVTSPHGGITLRASKEGPSQDEWTKSSLGTLLQSFKSGHDLPREKKVNVMKTNCNIPE